MTFCQNLINDLLFFLFAYLNPPFLFCFACGACGVRFAFVFGLDDFIDIEIWCARVHS